MGNKLSISCCSPSCISCCSPSSRRLKDRSRRQIQRGPEELSEHPKAPDSPKCDASARNDGSPRDTSDLRPQLNIDEERERVQREITKELKLKHGAEKLRTLVKDETHLAAVDDFLKKSEEKLVELYNSKPPISEPDVIIETEEPSEEAHTPVDGLTKDLEASNVEEADGPVDTSKYDPEVSVVEEVCAPAEDIPKDPEVSIVETPENEIFGDLELSIVEDVDAAADELFKDFESFILDDDDIPQGDVFNNLQLSIMENFDAPEDDISEDIDVAIIENVDTPDDEVVGDLEMPITDNLDAPGDNISKHVEASIIETPEDNVFGDLQLSIVEKIDAPVKDLDVFITENEDLPLDDVTDVPEVSIMENVPITENEALLLDDVTDVPEVSIMENVPITENEALPLDDVTDVPEVSLVENVPDPEGACFQPNHPLRLQDFSCCSLLGRGGFGKVLLAEHKTTKKMFAMKAIKKLEIVEADDIQGLMYEKHIFQAASRGRHSFLVNLFGSFQSIDHVFFVMEFAAGGDLTTHIKNAWGVFPIPRATFYAACVTLGLEYLHENKIVHRDLKLANVVLDKEGFAKITDFGNGKEGIGFGDRTSTFCGTLDYMAPEMFMNEPSYTRAVDWWSFGVMLYAMLFGKIPFQGDHDDELERDIINYNIQYDVPMPVRATRILQSLLKQNPDKRLGASENGAQDVKRHRFFTEIDWSELYSRKMKPPFVPTIHGPRDTRHFDTRFTSKAPNLTPPDESLTEEEQEGFRDFDWIAEWAE